MNPDELKSIWGQQPLSSAGVVRLTPEMIWRLASESTRFNRTIFWRDMREWLATVLVAGVLLYIACVDNHIHWPMVVAAIIACVPMTYVALRYRKRRAPDPNAVLTDHLRNSIANVQLQLDLLRSVAKWYLAPIALSILIFGTDAFFTAPVPPGARKILIVPFLLGALIGAGVFYAVWRMNDYAARTQLEPRLRELKQTLADVEKD